MKVCHLWIIITWHIGCKSRTPSGPFFATRPQIPQPQCENHRMDSYSEHNRSDAKGDFILFAEDHGATVELFVRMMRADGIENEVVVTRDGAAALDFLFGSGRDGAALPSLEVLDIGMPRVDGLEVLRRIRADERTELLPVVVLSANDGISEVSRAYRLGGQRIRKQVLGLLALSRLGAAHGAVLVVRQHIRNRPARTNDWFPVNL
jgi:two-component system, response regulator